MIVNENSLDVLTTAVQTRFNAGLARAQPTWNVIAMEVPSSTGENVYPFLRQLGGIRKWVGDRVIQNMAKGDFRIANEDFEETHAIPRKAIEDDMYGIYGNLYEQTGLNVARFADKSVYGLLKTGFNAIGPDGQYFFDVDHPVGSPGREASVANHMGGSGEAWFIVDSNQVFKPLIFQPRKAFELVTFFDPKDPARLLAEGVRLGRRRPLGLRLRPLLAADVLEQEHARRHPGARYADRDGGAKGRRRRAARHHGHAHRRQPEPAGAGQRPVQQGQPVDRREQHAQRPPQGGGERPPALSPGLTR